MEQFKNYVFDLPKRPLNAFSFYVRDRIPDLKQENEKAPTTKLIKMVAKEWKEEDGVSQSKYEKKAEQDRKRFSRQMKEFEKLGYYKKNSRGERTKKDEDEEEDEEEEEEVKSKKKMKKRGSSTASKSTRKGTKKTKSRSKSKSKTQESKRKRSMSKSKKKTGKTQKKK
jgi:high mobility group protein B2